MGFEPLAVLGGALMLVGLFLPWYSVIDVPEAFPRRDQLETYFNHTAWQAFAAVDVALAVLAFASLRSRAAAIAAAALIAYKMIDAPAFATLGAGPWLALVGALIAAAAPLIRPWMGAALLFAALFLPWYRDDIFIITRGGNHTETVSVLGGNDLTAWRVFTVLDVALVALALAATRSRVAGAAAVVLVAFRLIDTPTPIPDLATGPGAWLALAGALIALVARLRPPDAASP
jgi:hypothetical protein